MTTRRWIWSWTACIGLAFLGTAILAARDTDRLEHPTAGVVVVKPAGWQIGTIQQIEANRAKVRMNDEEWQKALQRSATGAAVSEISATTVSGLPAAHMKGAYTLVTQEGREFPTLTRLYVIPRGSFMFFIGMGGPQEGPDVSEAEFTAFIKSIQIQP